MEYCERGVSFLIKIEFELDVKKTRDNILG